MNHLNQNNIIPEEQKGGIADCYGCIDQLIINSMVLDDCKKRNKHLSIAWIDYKKAFDSIPHTWLIKSLQMHGFDEVTTNFFKTSITKWRTKLHLSSKESELFSDEIKINSGIFQGDCTSGIHFIICMLPLTFLLNRSNLGYYVGKGKHSEKKINHLIFMDDLKLYASNDNQLETLINITKIFSDDICMSFGLDKCNKITIKKGKLTNTGDIEINEESIKELNNSESYVYLGITERDKIFKKDMKIELKNEYFKRLRKILNTELNSSNLISAINTYAIPAISYGFQILDWSITELEEIDRDTRTKLKKQKILNINSNNDRIYLPRKQGGRGLLNITDQYKKAIINMCVYLDRTEQRLLKMVKDWTKCRNKKSLFQKANNYCEENNLEYENVKNINQATRKMKLKMSFHKTRSDKYEKMPLHGQHVRELNKPYIDKEKSIAWIRNGNLKATTESTIFAIQEQAATTNYIKKKYHHTSETDQCRLCKKSRETIHHVISGCNQLAKKEYLERHNNVAKEVYITIAEYTNLLKKNENKWYKFKPEPVIENDNYKLLWDFYIQTDKELEHIKPDIVLIDKVKRKCQIIDISIPSDFNIIAKRNEKVRNYIDLSIELKTLWDLVDVQITPVIIGATGAVYKNVEKDINILPGKIRIEKLQEIALIGTAYIWRRFNQLIRH